MGVNYTSFKWFWSSFLCDIRVALELAIKFPGTLKWLEKIQSGFQSRSPHSLIRACVGAPWWDTYQGTPASVLGDLEPVGIILPELSVVSRQCNIKIDSSFWLPCAHQTRHDLSDANLIIEICLYLHALSSDCIMDSEIQISHPHITLWWLLLFTWGGMYLLKVVSLIMKNPGSDLVSKKPPSDGDFIK